MVSCVHETCLCSTHARTIWITLITRYSEIWNTLITRDSETWCRAVVMSSTWHLGNMSSCTWQVIIVVQTFGWCWLAKGMPDNPYMRTDALSVCCESEVHATRARKYVVRMQPRIRQRSAWSSVDGRNLALERVTCCEL